MIHILWDDPDRLAAAKARYAAEPITSPRGVLDYATIAVLDPDAGTRAWAAGVAKQQLLALDISDAGGMVPDGNGCDQYRWNQWYPLAFDWVNDYLTAAERATVLDRGGRWVRTVMQQSWGGPLMVNCDYFWGNLNWEWCWSKVAAPYEDVSDIEAVWRSRWGHWQAWVADPANGPAGINPAGSNYGYVNYYYAIIPQLCDPQTFASDWYAAAVRHFAQAASAVPVQARGLGSYHQLFSFQDDEHSNGFPPLNNYALNGFLWAAQEFCAGQPEAGYAAWLLQKSGGRPDSPVYYGVAPAAPRPPSDLPLVTPYGPWVIVRQSWADDATVLFISCHHGTASTWGGAIHRDLGSFQVRKGDHWCVKNQAGYSTSFDGGPVLGVIPDTHFGCNSVPWIEYVDGSVSGPGEGVPGYSVTDDGDLVTVVLDLIPCWPYGPDAAVRTLAYRRSTDTLTVTDVIDTDTDTGTLRVRFGFTDPAVPDTLTLTTADPPSGTAYETGYYAPPSDDYPDLYGYFLDAVGTQASGTHRFRHRLQFAGSRAGTSKLNHFPGRQPAAVHNP